MTKKPARGGYYISIDKIRLWLFGSKLGGLRTAPTKKIARKNYKPPRAGPYSGSQPLGSSSVRLNNTACIS